MDNFESRINPRFLAESEKGMLWEPRVIESGREMVEVFKKMKKEREDWRASVLSSFSLSWFLVIRVFMSSVHALSSLVRLVTSLREADFWSCVSSAKSWWFTQLQTRMVSYDIGERCSVQDEENGPQYWALRHTICELWWWWRWVIDWSGLISVWEVWLKPLECSRLNAKNRVQAGEENLVVSSVKSSWKIQQKKNRNVVIALRGENIIYMKLSLWQTVGCN